MSFYATIAGQIKYKKQEDYVAAKEFLEKGGWIDDEGYFVDENGFRISEEQNLGSNQITIPTFHYRNLSYILNKPFIGGKGLVVWTSTDGCFQAGIIKNGVERCIDLEEWAKEQNLESPPEKFDNDQYWQDFSDWQQEIEMAFFEDVF